MCDVRLSSMNNYSPYLYLSKPLTHASYLSIFRWIRIWRLLRKRKKNEEKKVIREWFFLSVPFDSLGDGENGWDKQRRAKDENGSMENVSSMRKQNESTEVLFTYPLKRWMPACGMTNTKYKIQLQKTRREKKNTSHIQNLFASFAFAFTLQNAHK